MARIIFVASGKGGTGKTTLTSNLAYALAQLNKKVYVIDGNLTTPHLSFYFGFSLAKNTLHDFLKGKASIKDIVYFHPSGVRVIPGSLSLEELKDVETSRITNLILGLISTADFILIDGSAGIGRETVTSLNISDEVIIVAIPEITSLIDAIKISKLAKSLNKRVIGLVLNRVSKKMKKERLKKIVENFTGIKVIGCIPEDKNVGLSILYRKPLLEVFPNSPFSLEAKKIAYSLVGKRFKYESKSFFKGLVRKIFRL